VRYLITGATGLIGFSLIEKLLKENHSVTVLSNSSRKACFLLERFKVKLINCSLADYRKINLRSSYDIFIHMAWQGGEDRNDIFINQASALAVVDAVDLACRHGCTKFIGIGSQAEYGLTKETLDESTPCYPASPFGIAKLNAYYNAKFKAEQMHINFTWLRILSVYGPFDRSNSLITSTIRKVLSGQTPSFTTGSQFWDFLYVDDAADAIFKVSTIHTNSELYILGSGCSAPLKSYIELLCKELQFDPEPYFGTHTSSQDEVYSLACDMSLFKANHNWFPTFTFQKGIAITIEHEKIMWPGFQS